MKRQSKKNFLVATMLSGILPLFADALQNELKFYLSCDDMQTPVDGCKILNSIRLRPEKYGQSFLIERRTCNFADIKEMVLGEGVTMKGKDNILELPANGFVALPFPQIRPSSENCLSFIYAGSGKITVTLDSDAGSVTVAELNATVNPQRASIAVVPKSDSVTLKIRSEQAITLSQLMFDKGISFANTYHAPGKMRNVDWIVLPPTLFDRTSGAFVCWVKAPWLKKDSKVSKIGLLSVRWAEKAKGKFGTNYLKWISVWDGYFFDANQGKDSTVTLGFGLKDIEQEPSDGWYHFVFNWKYADGTMNTEIIVNGKYSSKKASSYAINPEPIDFIIGYAASYYLNGQIDDIALFKRPLSMDEAQKIFSAGKPLPEAIQ